MSYILPKNQKKGKDENTKKDKAFDCTILLLIMVLLL